MKPPGRLNESKMNSMTIEHDKIVPYRLSVNEVLTALGTDARNGLSKEEAQARLERYGKNELTAEKPVPAWRKFLAQFQDMLVILLLIATLISAGLWLYERDSACLMKPLPFLLLYC